jgi:peptidylprolyl isomerase
MIRHLVVVAVAVALLSSALLALSCGGSETTPTPEGTSTPAPAARQAGPGDLVKVHYTGTKDDGSEFDSSRNRGPLEFTVGAGQMIAGFDQAVVGMSVGESKTVRMPPEEAYGPYLEELVQVISRDLLPANIEVGSEVTAEVPGAGTILFRVKAISDTEVTLDANHRLAGEHLTFEIEMVEIQ